MAQVAATGTVRAASSATRWEKSSNVSLLSSSPASSAQGSDNSG
ncbi:hypothetical protein [Blastococcus sp. VKM Ac-2987]|nr:hypothetical protein [Blastococcus sp. VKM Ac-2987]MCZ2857479.1 hypothetical protein [Blastococcus sp. VKM Ac-2987]